MFFKIVAMGVALYSFALLFSSLIKLPTDHLLVDASTGNLSVAFAIVISGVLMLAYAVSGGLWAVLIIDAIQFVVLTAIVLFVVPLSFSKAGGLQNFMQTMPADFLKPTGGGFTFYFLIGWVLVHTFKLGGEWVFIQRFLAVSSPANARKSSYLFGTLYVVSPIIWMLPPMLYRTINPAAPPQQAYIMACAAVLPAGMIGLLLAAMFSSAASYIDGEVNVYAGAVTNDVYKPFFNPGATEKKLVWVGRISSIGIGGTIMLIALSIPFLGGAEQVILTMTSLLVVAMVLPVLWGLYFGKIRQNAIWISTGATIIVALFLKLLIPSDADNAFIRFYQINMKEMDVAIGLLVPILSLMILELTGKNNTEGFIALQKSVSAISKIETVPLDKSVTYFPAKLLAFSIGGLSLLMFGLLLTADHSFRFLIALFASLLLLISIAILTAIKRAI
jgi:Na+/proline symporter